MTQSIDACEVPRFSAAERFVGRVSADAVLIAGALLFSCCSLTYPFGHDQGVHYYMGREWLHGAIPYRDAFDYKTPGIFAIYALLTKVFGGHQWTIRAAELACVTGLGFVCSRLSEKRPRPGLLGVSCLSAHFFYFGFFNYWDTAQCEIWCVTFAFTAIAAAYRVRSDTLASLTVGGSGGLALLMKPPCAFFVAIAVAVVVVRASNGRARRLLLTLAALGFFPGATLLYFAMKGAILPLYEVLVGANSQYITDARKIDSLGELISETYRVLAWFNPYTPLALALVAVAIFRGAMKGDWALARRYRLPALLTLAALAGVGAQMKFYRYHWALLVGPATLTAALVFNELVEAFPRARTRFASSLFVLGGFLLFPLAGAPAASWLWGARLGLLKASGRMSEADFALQFVIPGLLYSYRDSEQTGDWLRAHTRPGDLIAVRGHQAEIYAVAERHCAGRFFWTVPFIDPSRGFRRSEFLAEDRDAVVRSRPSYIVTLSDVREGPDSTNYFLALGYRKETEFGRLTVLGRDGIALRAETP